MRRWLLAVLVAALAGPALPACRQALALGMDVSGSVDATEYALQRDGLAAALADPEVQAAFLAVPQAPVRLMVFEWSGTNHQREVLGWTDINSAADLRAAAGQVLATRPVQIKHPNTAMAAAMRHGARELMRQAGCWQLTLDLSGDGPGNVGRHPGDLGPETLGDVTINGLVINPQSRANTSKNLANVKSLEGYYRAFVIRGPGAFVEVALDHADFGAAMKRKLIRELQAPQLSLGPQDRFAQALPRRLSGYGATRREDGRVSP